MSNAVHVVTGANRGIGFSLVKELSGRANTIVIATARAPQQATELNAWIKSHSNVHVLAYDASKRGDAKQLASATSKLVDGVDVLHANAGQVEIVSTVLKTPVDVYEQYLNVNAVGPIELVQQFYPLLSNRKTRKIVFTSTAVASMGNYLPLQSSAYGSSKAALNFVTKALSSELASEGFTAVALHPGSVSTDGGANYFGNVKKVNPQLYERIQGSIITPDESAKKQLRTVDELTAEQNGHFINVDGSDLPY